MGPIRFTIVPTALDVSKPKKLLTSFTDSLSLQLNTSLAEEIFNSLRMLAVSSKTWPILLASTNLKMYLL